MAHGFGLRFGERESEAEAERRTERSRSGTTVAEPQAESPPIIRHYMSLVTDALFEERNRRGREGIWPNSGRWSGAKCALVTAEFKILFPE